MMMKIVNEEPGCEVLMQLHTHQGQIPGYRQWWKFANKYYSRSNCSVAEFFPEKSGWCRDELICQR